MFVKFRRLRLIRVQSFATGFRFYANWQFGTVSLMPKNLEICFFGIRCVLFTLFKLLFFVLSVG